MYFVDTSLWLNMVEIKNVALFSKSMPWYLIFLWHQELNLSSLAWLRKYSKFVQRAAAVSASLAKHWCVKPKPSCYRMRGDAGSSHSKVMQRNCRVSGIALTAGEHEGESGSRHAH